MALNPDSFELSGNVSGKFVQTPAPFKRIAREERYSQRMARDCANQGINLLVFLR